LGANFTTAPLVGDPSTATLVRVAVDAPQHTGLSAPLDYSSERPLPAGVYRVGGGVKAPSLTSKVEPQYTEEGRAGKVQGVVILQVDIDPQGMAQNVEVIGSLEPGLDQKAIEAVRQWRFNPGTKDGQQVTVRATIEVNFRLM